LLTRSDYLAPYPTLASYLAQHPEVAHNPGFFIGGNLPASSTGTTGRRRCTRLKRLHRPRSAARHRRRHVAIVWLARAAIDHRRWLRATKIQTDAHTKIVDRLSSNEDLLAYMQSTTGQRF